MKITIGIPAYNEEKNIASVITKLKKITDSIIVCDDGSSDLTVEIARGLGAIVISHSKNHIYLDPVSSDQSDWSRVDSKTWSATDLLEIAPGDA